MRLRNLKDKDILVENCDYLIKDGESLKGKWQVEFGNNNAIHIEIGMGKGDYIYHMALKYPNINFIGIEKYSGVIARAIKKYPDKLANLRIINMDALNLNDVFSKEVETIYLNFSDPWPKKRHASRRLSSEVFLKIYDDVFKNKKRIVMKTDNLILFQSSL
ncbi:MAG: tRNA (guanosine(46)-N7)-methyltransferase TrmB, partial [Bacilli bacterium]|nr:tRNA (guanosine(46)-N7)-methyltransferase TrmB [Bacilli bacterium]